MPIAFPALLGREASRVVAICQLQNRSVSDYVSYLVAGLILIVFVLTPATLT